MSVKFFGKVDINTKGRIASHMPAWTMTTQIEDMKEDIERKERAVERGEIAPDEIMKTKEELKREKEKLDSIMEGRPKLSETEENAVHKTYKTLGDEIKKSMFTRSEMQLGLASAHEEVRRMKDPIISIDKNTAGLCEENGIKVSRSGNSAFVSRDGASKLWKIIGRYFGESSNIESLRRDRVTARR